MSATQDEVNKQRAALLTAVAQQGTAGKTAYEAEAARQAEYAKAAAAAVAQSTQMTGSSTPAALLAQIRAQDAAQNSVYSQDNTMALTNYQNSMNQTSMSNAAYMDQARAAVPVVEAQTAGTIAQIRARQEEERLQREEAAKERAYNERMRALGLQEKEQGSNADAQQFLQEGQAQARAAYLKRAYIEDGLTGDVLKEIASKAETLDDGVQYVEGALRKKIGDKAWRALGPTKRANAVREMQRYVLGYYTGTTGSNDPQSLGYQIRKYGGDPSMVPGYLNASERSVAADHKAAAAKASAEEDFRTRLARELSSSGVANFNTSMYPLPGGSKSPFYIFRSPR
jgi:hypothetical protein